jgi:hypothetical protein
MKKVILLSTVLGMGALGMACGESANNTSNAKPVNIAPAASPVTTVAPMASPVTNMKPSNMATNTMKPANMSNANKK